MFHCKLIVIFLDLSDKTLVLQILQKQARIGRVKIGRASPLKKGIMWNILWNSSLDNMNYPSSFIFHHNSREQYNSIPSLVLKDFFLSLKFYMHTFNIRFTMSKHNSVFAIFTKSILMIHFSKWIGKKSGWLRFLLSLSMLVLNWILSAGMGHTVKVMLKK